MRWLLLALLLPVLAHAAHPDCFETAQQKLKNNLTKQCKVVDYPENFNRWRRPLPVKWQVTDPELGVVRVAFPLLYEASSYSVFLLVNETVATPESCALPGAFDSTAEAIHTRTTFHPAGCQGRDAPDRALPKGLEVEFRFVFSGCYRLKVAPKGSPTNVSASRFLRTGYVKEVLQPPNVTRNFYPDRNVAFVSFKYSWGPVPLVVSMRHGIRPEMGSQACQTSGTVYACCSLHLLDAGSEVCEPNSTLAKRPNCDYEKEGGLTCEFFDLVPGNYCFTAEVLGDVRCSYGKVWERNKCLWNTPLEISAPSVLPSEHVIPTPWSEGVWYLLGPLLALGALLGLVTYGYRLHGKPSHPHPHSHGDEEGEDDSGTSLKAAAGGGGGGQRQWWSVVLLLYAQDCEPLMALMSAFRRLLGAAAGGCEVLDPLAGGGAALLEALAPAGPLEWLRGTLRRPDALVVLVETPCAALLHRALEAGRPPPRYRRPLPHSGLFPHALQQLGLQGADSYRRLLVVRFRGLGDAAPLAHLTPYRRFTLPQHLPQLLESLGAPRDCDAAPLLEALEEADACRASGDVFLAEDSFVP